jgi:hypothetical protein
MTTTSITDKPISSLEEDQLQSKKYAETLASFIQRSDTPLTVGLQGEWGTGKTSMMYMLREILDKQDVATSWVNTWEYSMFRGAHETTPAVLKGMLDKLKESCVEKGTWSVGDEASQKVQKIGRFIGNLANQVVRNQVGIDVKDAAQGNANSEQLATEISFVKAQIKEVIDDLLKDSNNKYNRVVFFVDDLDRIPPTDAVEVLEALKNMFDVPNCIYVLAIDYDVVVKGLEGKFGKKTEENEREFRSFFDKIIQVPFSMPTGTYDITQLLVSKLANMGIEIPEDQKDYFTDVVKYTVGFNPRSLKRFMNSFSLLRSLRQISEDGVKVNKYDDLVLFGLLGLQISYSKVFRLITTESRFWDWDSAFANKMKVSLDDVKEQIEDFDPDYKNKTDEDWEQIIYGFCNKPLNNGRPDPYLSARWENIVDLLNMLAVALMGKDFSQANDNERSAFEESWNNGLSFASITNVDDDPSAKMSSEKKRVHVRFESVEDKIRVIEGAAENPANVTLWKLLVNRIREEGQGWSYNLMGSYITTKNSNDSLFFKLYNPSAKSLGITALVYHKKERKGSTEIPENTIRIESKSDTKTQFKIKMSNEEEVKEALMLFEWASRNSN